VFRDSVFSLITTVVRLATGVVLFVVLAHVWGPERFGVFMYPFTIAGILVKLVDYGFLLQVARDVGRKTSEAHETMSRALGAKLLLVVPAVAVAAVIPIVMPGANGFGALLGFMMVDAICTSFVQFLCIPLRALGHFDREARVASLSNGIVFVSVVATALTGHGPLMAAAVMAGTRAACMILPWMRTPFVPRTRSTRRSTSVGFVASFSSRSGKSCFRTASTLTSPCPIDA
jgi:O-antigen/teichoic acid export membrane protein